MTHTSVRLPVREADTLVRHRALANGDPLQPQDGGVMAHITLLSPFLPEPALDGGAVSELEHYFADQGQFGFDLVGVSQFPADGPAYLVPEPASLFRELAQGLLSAFPDLTPLTGSPRGRSIDDLVPHLSVPLAVGESVEHLREELAHRFPIQATAFTATLVRVAPHDTRTLATFPFGSTAA